MAEPPCFVDLGDVKTETIEMRSTLLREYEGRPRTWRHEIFTHEQPWPRKTDILCWHCCHSFDTMPVPLVARYDYDRKTPVCFGVFCSPNCGRAYAISERPLSWAHAMLFYSDILAQSFGINPELSTRPAWPKQRLRVFGGDLTIEEYRAGFQTPTVQRVETVAFCIQNLLIVEVSPDQVQGVSVGGLNPTATQDERLNVLAQTLIEESHKKVAVDMESAREADHLLSLSLLEQFVENMRNMQGNVTAAKEALLDVVPKATIVKKNKKQKNS